MISTLLTAAAGALSRNHMDEASRLLRRILAVEPAHVGAARNLGGLIALGRDPARADAVLSRAVAAAPDDASLWEDFATTALQAARSDQAACRSRRAISLTPASATAHTWLGAALDLGGPHTSLIPFRRALSIDALAIDPRLGLAKGLIDRDVMSEAARHSRTLLALRPGSVEASANLTVAIWDLGDRRQAILQARRTLAMKPTLAPAAWILAQGLLASGEYEEGLSLLDSRWGLPEFRSVNGRDLPWPFWDGRVRPGLKLLLWAEQGFGDALQFVRYAPILANRGVEVTVEAPMALESLFRSIGVRVSRRDALPSAIDAQAPLMSLPYLCATRLETIPANVPYLAAPKDRRIKWRERLSPLCGSKIGLCWQGNPAFRRDPERSPGFAPMRPLLDRPGPQLIGLVRDLKLEDSHPRLLQLGPDFADFADTAACLEQLDLVITSDTALAHLAGALARPTWLLLHHTPDWRWHETRSDSPWYPTFRLFRQPTPGDWQSVIREVANELDARS